MPLAEVSVISLFLAVRGCFYELLISQRVGGLFVRHWPHLTAAIRSFL
jgi:hypothetical protein